MTANSRTLPLFDVEPTSIPTSHLAARNDPATSHEAAEKLVRSGQAKTQADQVAAALLKHRGYTSRELAKISGLDRHLVARRLSGLEREKPPRAKRGPTRKCSIGQLPAVTWLPMDGEQ